MPNPPERSHEGEEMSKNGPCQFCMSGSSFGREDAQLVLYEGQWQPWPLVSPRPNAPVIRTSICPVCERERFNAEAIPILNEKIAEHQRAAKSRGQQ